MSSKDPVQLPLDALVSDTPFRNAGVDWSYAVDELLNVLVTRANEQGAKTNRRELAAAILCSAQTHSELLNLVISYRQLRVRSLTLSQPTEGNVIHIRRHGPGPRTAHE